MHNRCQRVCAALIAGSLVTAAMAGTPLAPASAKVDPALKARLQQASDGRASFLVVLQEQADLSPARQLLDKKAKGAFVFAALRETAARTQKTLVTQLQARGSDCRPFWIVNAVSAQGDAAVVAMAASRDDVIGVVADFGAATALPKPERLQPMQMLGVEWGVAKIHAPEVWALGITGQGVVVGGQDTGYTWDHPALKSAYRGWDGAQADHNYNWHDAIHAEVTNGSASAVPWDDNNHGTHTMGTMVGLDGANQVGVAPGARWIGCRNMAYGDGTYTRYLECFEWMLAPTDLAGQHPDPSKAPDVMNNSWGFTVGEGCTNVNMLKSVVEACRAAGIVVVVSAGNSGPSAGSVSDSPSIYAASFTVGATDADDTIAGFSSRGPVTADGSGRRKPDVCAPGVSVRSCIPSGYASLSGTSMAGPHTVGAVALVLSAHPALKGQVDRIESLLERTAQPCGQSPDNTYGWGRVDALAAVGLGDSDGDSLPNWWEYVFGLNPAQAGDAADDPDKDGMSTWQEWICNTDPTNAFSVLRLDNITLLPGGEAELTWRSRQDGFREPQSYAVVCSETVTQTLAQWTVALSNVPPAGDWTTTVTLPAPTNGILKRFYRIAVVTTNGVVLSSGT